jgi:Tfp pilus assembly protein PilP
MRKVIFLSVIIVLLITLQSVRGEEVITSGEIEIISYKVNMFTSPVDGDKMTKKPVTSISGKKVTSTGRDPFQSPMDDKKLPETFNTNTTEPHRENPFINPMPDDKPPVIDNKGDRTIERQKEEKISGVNAENLFKYTGVLWNGSQYLGIITSDRKSFVVRTGDELIEGYRVLYLDEKEIIVEKKGQKNSIKLQ